jgi:hypothetical protein
MTTLTNRRGVLSLGGKDVAFGALAAAPAMALPVTVPQTQQSRIAWDKAMAAFVAAQHADNAYEDEVYAPLRRRLEALSPRPDFRFYGPADQSGYRPQFHLYADDLHRLDGYPLIQVREEAARIRAAWENHRSTASRIGADTVAIESDRLSEMAAECERTLMLMPAPNMTAFLWKIERMYGSESGRADGEEGDGFRGAWTDALVTDARRLARR